MDQPCPPISDREILHKCCYRWLTDILSKRGFTTDVTEDLSEYLQDGTVLYALCQAMSDGALRGFSSASDSATTLNVAATKSNSTATTSSGAATTSIGAATTSTSATTTSSGAATASTGTTTTSSGAATTSTGAATTSTGGIHGGTTTQTAATSSKQKKKTPAVLPPLTAHNKQNLQNCLYYIKNKMGSSLPGTVSPSSLADSREDSALQLVWWIAHYCEVCSVKQVVEGKLVSGSKGLLSWCSQFTDERLTDFSTCWKDGSALLSMLSAHGVDVPGSLTTDREKISAGQETVTSKLGVIALLDPEDLDEDDLDCNSMMLFIALVHHQLEGLPAKVNAIRDVTPTPVGQHPVSPVIEVHSLHLINLSDTEKFRIMNKKAADEIIPNILKLCLRWDCHKTCHENFYTYLQNLPMSDKNRAWVNDNKDKLMKHVDDYDVSFLYDLLPYACPNIDNFDGNKCFTGSLEYALRSAKDLRNSVMHEPNGAAISPDVLPKIESESMSVIQLCGRNFRKSTQDIRGEIDALRQQLIIVKECVTTSEEKRIAYTADVLRRKSKIEQKTIWQSAYGKEYLPFSSTSVSRSAVFHPIILTFDPEECRDPNEHYQVGSQINCADILKIFHQFNDVHFIFIEGVAGSGKSTLLKQIGQNYLDQSDASCSSMFPNMNGFEYLIYIECRSTKHSTFSSYLSGAHSRTMKQLNPDEVLKAVRDLNCLALIDGLDEMTSQSRQLVDDVIEHFKGYERGKFIVTSRPISSKNLRRKLNNHGASLVTLTVNEISGTDEQLQFLERYQEAIPDIRSPELVQDFKSMIDLCSPFFQYPIYLTLFCHLYKEDASAVRKWENEASIMKQTLKLCESMIVNRLDERGIGSAANTSRRFVKILCQFCLQWLQQEKLIIGQESCNEFRERYSDEVKVEIPIDEALSCILQEKRSLLDTAKATYHFPHKSFQEYMAALALLPIMEERPGVLILDIISELNGTLIDKAIIQQKYLSVFKFVLLEMSSSERSNRLEDHRQAEILKLLVDSGADFSYWCIIALGCRSCLNLVSEVSKAAAALTFLKVEEGGYYKDGVYKHPTQAWLVRTPTDATAVAIMLPHAQPPTINVCIATNQSMPSNVLIQLLQAIVSHFIGFLELFFENSYENYMPMDDALKILVDIKGQVTKLTCCVESAHAVKSIMGLLRAKGRQKAKVIRLAVATELNISVANAKTHPLRELEMSDIQLLARLRYTPAEENNSPSASPGCAQQTLQQLTAPHLPRGAPSPQLVLDCAQASHIDMGRIAEIITDLAPKDNKFGAIILENCPLSKEDLRSMTNILHEEDLQTTTTTHNIGWKNVESTSGRCHVCGRGEHLPGVRCVELHMASPMQVTGARLLRTILTPQQVSLFGSAMGALLGPVLGSFLFCYLVTTSIVLIGTFVGPYWGPIVSGVIGGIVGIVLTPVFLVIMRRLFKTCITRFTWQISGSFVGIVIAIALILEFLDPLQSALGGSKLYFGLILASSLIISSILGFLWGTWFGPAVGFIPGAVFGTALGKTLGMGMMCALGWVIGATLGASFGSHHLSILKISLSPLVGRVTSKSSFLDGTLGVFLWDALHMLVPVALASLFALAIIARAFDLIFWIYMIIFQFSVVVGILGPTPEVSLASSVGAFTGAALGTMIGTFLFEFLVSVLMAIVVFIVICVPTVILFFALKICLIKLNPVSEHHSTKNNIKTTTEGNRWLDPVLSTLLLVSMVIISCAFITPSISPIIQILLQPSMVSILGPVLFGLIGITVAIFLGPMLNPLIRDVYSIYFKEVSFY